MFLKFSKKGYILLMKQCFKKTKAQGFLIKIGQIQILGQLLLKYLIIPC